MSAWSWLSLDEKKSVHWETLRGISMLIMMLIHAGQILGWSPIFPRLIDVAFPSIEMIILLSGFLICRGSCRTIFSAKYPLRDVLKNYAIRRIVRTWPLYFLYVFVIFLIPTAIIGEINTPLWQFLTFTFNWKVAFPDFGAGDGLLLHLWSACLEEWCYLFFLFLIPFLRHRWINLVFILFALYPIVARYFVIDAHSEQIMGLSEYAQNIHVGTFVRWDSFWWGCLLGRWYYVSGMHEKISLRQMKIFLGMGLFVTAVYIFTYYNSGLWFRDFKNIFNPLIGALASAFFILGVRAIPAHWLRASLIPHVGYRAYTAYLVHISLMTLYVYLREQMGGVIRYSYSEIVLLYVFVLGISFVLFALIEKHILNLLDRKFALKGQS